MSPESSVSSCPVFISERINSEWTDPDLKEPYRDVRWRRTSRRSGRSASWPYASAMGQVIDLPSGGCPFMALSRRSIGLCPLLRHSRHSPIRCCGAVSTKADRICLLWCHRQTSSFCIGRESSHGLSTFSAMFIGQHD